jgi:methionine-rich copper-binding protein CopC
MLKPVAALAALTLLAASQAQAHAKLTAEEPAANATVAAPARLVLRFSEKLDPKFSGLALSRGGAPVAAKVAVGSDGDSLVAAPAKPLTPGVYRVDWHSVAVDAHRLTGSYSFTVR